MLNHNKHEDIFGGFELMQCQKSEHTKLRKFAVCKGL